MKKNKILSVMGNTSIKYRFLAFSLLLFLLILLGGGAAFFFSMNQVIRSAAAGDLSLLVETRRLQLEGKVSREIALALKMADSPLIRQHFLDPENPQLETLAFAEIAGYRSAFTGNNVFWISDADKKYYFGSQYVYTLDPKAPDSDWYTWTLTQEKLFNFNVNYDIGLKKTMLWINAQVYEKGHEGKGKAIGIVGTGIDLTDFINALFQDDLAGEDQNAPVELYLFNEKGEITGARDSALMEKKETIPGIWKEDGGEAVSLAKELSPEEVRAFTLEGNEYAVGRLPQLNWYIAVFMPLAASMILKTPLAGFFALMLLVILFIFVIINIFIFRLVKPLNKSVLILGEIAESWDLTRRLEVPGRDEIGSLARIFNVTFEKIQSLVTVIRDKTQSLSKTGGELAGEMDSTASSVNQMTATIQNMKSQTENQAGEVARVGNSMTSIINHIEKLNGHIAQQSESVCQSSSAIEEMLANVHSVTGTLIKNSENVKNLAESAEVSRSDLQSTAAEFQEIARQSEGLLEINSVMENISSQTNLLSMNAAIEAAHAGEAGKGFAVVAGEIRKLAEDAGRQSKTTVEMLKKIKTSIDMVTESTGRVLARFEAISAGVKTVAEQEEGIRSAMEEQETGSRQILEAVTLLKEVSETVRSEAGGIAEEGQVAIRESENLDRITQEIENGMNELASGAEHINAAVNRINEISSGNKTSIDTLSREVLKFKV
ncbi:MAG: methyl-accepting chemotaxis protein [Spirochaetales bacterium]|jgi:methyl-accepting chemotaxis protein|nr:methyl-accepting chemotaxis protein [Spirochaetales bacterium]